MSGNLQKLVQAEGIFEILDFEFIPWGNAYYNTSECGRPLYPTDNETWSTGYNSDAKQCWIKQCQADKSKCFASDTVVCQHGYNECAVDTIEACAMKYYPDPQVYVPFVDCFEGVLVNELVNTTSAPGLVPQLGALCAAKQGLDWAAVDACFKGPEGEALDQENAYRTAVLKPEHQYTPWVTINGQPQLFPEDDDSDYNPLDYLLEWVCGNYTGSASLPAGCKSV